MAALLRLRFVLVPLTAALTVVGVGATSATAATPVTHGGQSAGGHADIQRHTAPPAGVADLAPRADPTAAARHGTVPNTLTAKALADKAKASTGFRSPNQKPVATVLSEPTTPKPTGPIGLATAQTLATTFHGLTDTGVPPPDTIMAAGPSNVVLAVNAPGAGRPLAGAVAIYNKVGTQLSMTPLSDVFTAEGQPAQDKIFDPWVVYDPYINRFWLMALSSNDNPNRSTILLALSRSSDATDGWDTSHFDATLNGDDSTDNWCDHAKVGFDTQAIYITCAMFAFPTDSTDFQDTKIKVMTKGQFLSGPCCKWWDFWDLGEGPFGLQTPGIIQPARMFGATDADGMYLVDAHGGGGDGDELEVWHFTNPGNCCGDNPSAPDLEQEGRDVGDYDAPPAARQQGASATLDTLDTRLQFAFWQDGHLSTGQNLACPDANAACVAYTEIDVSQYPDMSVINDFVVNQDQSIDRLYPSADPNNAGEKALVYTISGPNRFAGTSFVTIPPSSACTNCTGSEISTAPGLGPYGTSGEQRWGDYSGASRDPDGDGVWVDGEFANTAGQWGTQVALTMDRIPTAITYTGPLGADSGATIQLSANLVQATGGSPAPLPGGLVTFFVGTQVCNATTDTNGRAACSVTLDQPDGTVDLEAEYPGDPDHGVASAKHQFVIGGAGRVAPALTYTGARTGEFQARANLSARLVDPTTGSGIAGAQLTFTLGAQSCTAITEAAGQAACTLLLQQRPGAYTVTASFTGNAIYASANISAPFTITKGRTITTLTSSANPSDFGQDITFTATVIAANAGPVTPAGQVAFKRSTTIGLGTGSLDPVGHSTLTVPILQVGQNAITATYGGNDFFLDSTGSLVQTVTCSRTLTGVQSGGLDLTAGSTCLHNATVNGRITIASGAAVSISNSHLNGAVTATDGLALTVCGSVVNGDIRVSGTAKFVLLGDGGDDGAPPCAGNTVRGNVTIFASRGQAEVSANTISEDLLINESSGTGPDDGRRRAQIEANTIGDDLFCTGNTPPPTNDGHPNSITGDAFGQCIGF